MRRRSFLQALLGVAAAPAVAMLPAPAAEELSYGSFDIAIDQMRGPNPLFRGELGRYDGIRCYDGMQWSEAELAELEAAGEAPLVINMTRPLVDYLIGSERTWA
jgi:hypothetical protein